MAVGFGIYVHFPWCRSLCPYCDFAVAVPGRSGIAHDDYLAAVLTELSDRADDFAEHAPTTLYFGGGTPSLWRPTCLARLVGAIERRFGVSARDLEITLEANPSDCSADNLASWRAAGINRLSIGVQSTEPRALAMLGRDHRHGDGPDAVARALAAGFARVSADVIFAVPATGPGIDPAIEALCDLGVGHLSVYELTIEDRTRFGSMVRRGRMQPIDDDAVARTYTAIHEHLGARGFEHYEISSYAHTGQRSQHNQLYWRGAEYLGLGNGAASFRRRPDGGGIRTTNVRAVRPYLRAQSMDAPALRRAARVAEELTIEPHELNLELCWLGLRTSDGIPISALNDTSGVTEWLRQGGFVKVAGQRLQPTLKGFLFANQVAAQIVARCGRP